MALRETLADLHSGRSACHHGPRRAEDGADPAGISLRKLCTDIFALMYGTLCWRLLFTCAAMTASSKAELSRLKRKLFKLGK